MNINVTKPSLYLVSAASLAGFCHFANAAAFIDLGNNAGSQCETAGVNDNGLVVGNCSEPNFVPNNEPWVANVTTAGPQQPLASMVTDQPCWVMGAANSGTLAGACEDNNSDFFAVVWTATAPGTVPLKLNPLPGGLLPPLIGPYPDQSTSLRAFSQQGDILGESMNAKNIATVVLYGAGSATPIQVSNRGDNCVGVDMINRGASIVMNCPRSPDVPTGTFAQVSGSSYSITTLPIPSGATNCTVSAINNQQQIVGNCMYPNSTTNVRKAAYWATPTSAPQLLTLSSGSKSRARSINNNGLVLVVSQDTNGKPQYQIWQPSSSSTTIIPPPATNAWITGAMLADSNTVVLNSLNANQHLQAYTWSTTNGTQLVPPINGGMINSFTSISQNGAFAGGDNIDGTQDVSAVATTLP